LKEPIRDEAVIAIHCPRSVGKSTVLRRFAVEHGVEVIDPDDLGVRDAVAANPTVSVSGEAPLCIDEYQHVPQVLDAFKARLNREGTRPGLAVLTGSTRQDAVPRTAQALTGRLHSLVILPFSQGEIGGVHENLVPALLEDPEAAVNARPTSALTRADYAERIAAGGFSLALQRTGSARNRWFDNYVRTSIDRDAMELARIGNGRLWLNCSSLQLAGQRRFST